MEFLLGIGLGFIFTDCVTDVLLNLKNDPIPGRPESELERRNRKQAAMDAKFRDYVRKQNGIV